MKWEFKNTAEIVKDAPSQDVYSWYAKAMLRRDREPLSENSFNYHFFESGSLEETVAFGENNKGYLLGFKKHKVFTPTHFAPKTIRGGYELFKALGESEDIPAVLAITEDLAETLEKMV